MFITKSSIFLYMCFLYTACCQKEGEPCDVDSIRGICKSIFDCPYALRLVTDHETKPPMCGREGDKAIVCCPYSTEETPVRSFKISHGETFTPKAESKTCLNNDQMVFQDPDSPEPAECPLLERPELSAGVQHLAWSKCLDYQRYSRRCVPINKEGTMFNRIDSCGVKERSHEFPFMGGYPVTPMEFPHLVTLGFDDYGGEIVWSGMGTLISDTFVLTAAHVLIKNGLVKYALMGSVNRTGDGAGVVYNVARLIPYMTYSGGYDKNDVLLLELTERIMFSEFIRPACLPVPGRALWPDRIVTGWADVGDGDETSSILLMNKVVENVRRCGMMFLRSDFESRFMICVKGNFGTDMFKADSGSPLMAQLLNLKCSYSVEGISSINNRRDATLMYTNVSKYLDWIVRTIWPDDYKAWRNQDLGLDVRK